AVAVVESDFDQRALGFIESRPERYMQSRRPHFWFRCRHRHRDRQVELENVVGEDEAALYCVLELSYVAGPPIRPQRIEERSREALLRIVRSIEHDQKVLG